MIDVAEAESYKEANVAQAKLKQLQRNDVVVTDRQNQPFVVSTRCVHAFLARSDRGDIFPRQVSPRELQLFCASPHFM